MSCICHHFLNFIEVQLIYNIVLIYAVQQSGSVLYICIFIYIKASLVAQLVKNSPAMQETWVRSLDWEDPPEKGMATHSSILAWSIPWTEEPGSLQSMGSQRVGHN